jgi:glycine betaine/proline transport system substrate-binding protein
VSRLARVLLIACLLLSSRAPAAEAERCRNIRLGVVGFSDVTAVSTVAAEILGPLGYRATTVNLSVPIIFASMAAGNVDVFLGNWMPAQEGDRRPYVDSGSVEILGPNLEGARFTLAVPGYLYEAGLHSFADIQRFGAQLNASIYGIEPGAAANRLVLQMIHANDFGLGGFKLIESSEQGMLAELERAWRGRRPIVFVGWSPHPMNVRFQIEYLAGGDRIFGPNFGGASINTVTRAGFGRECPNAARLLRNLHFTVPGESQIMAAVLDSHSQPEIAARSWIDANHSTVAAWLDGVTAFDGTPRPSVASAEVAEPSGDRFDLWLSSHKIPVGATAASLLEWVKARQSGPFDVISATVRTAVDAMTRALRSVAPLPFILIASLLSGLLRRSWALGGFVLLALAFILNQGYWAPMLETLALVCVAVLIAVAVGVPIGIAGAHHPRWYATLRPVLDLMQTLPTFVYLIPTLVLFGLGPVPGLISTVIFALPAPIRLTQAGIAAVPAPLKEAAQAFGATNLQMLLKVELPSAAPLILAGVTQCIMLSLSMVVIAGLVGAGGLGVPVVRALNSVQVGQGFEAGFAIVLLAILLDRLSRPRS